MTNEFTPDQAFGCFMLSFIFSLGLGVLTGHYAGFVVGIGVGLITWVLAFILMCGMAS